MKIIIIIVLLISAIIQDIKLKYVEEELEAIKSWYPFCEFMKMKIQDDKGGDDE